MCNDEKALALAVIKGTQLLLDRVKKYDAKAEFMGEIERNQKAEQIYWAAGEAMVQAKNLLQVTSDAPLVAQQILEDRRETAERIDAGFEDFAPDYPSFHCQFSSAPVLKTKAATSKFFELFCLDLQRIVVRNLPDTFKRMESAVVVFVSHYAQSTPHKQPYFDNDNLAIKAILDSTVPYICFDDASKYCDNLYLSQPGQDDYSELFVVRKFSFPLWVTKHQELDFCSNLASFFGSGIPMK